MLLLLQAPDVGHAGGGRLFVPAVGVRPPRQQGQQRRLRSLRRHHDVHREWNTVTKDIQRDHGGQRLEWRWLSNYREAGVKLFQLS